jgi:signal transduction histidine kinase/HAMP domain-containing protein
VFLRKYLNTIQSKLIFLLVMALVPIAIFKLAIHYTVFSEERARAMEENLHVARGVAGAFTDFLRDINRQELTIGTAMTLLPLSDRETEVFLNLGKIEERVIPDLAWLDPQGWVKAASDPAALGLDLSDRSYLQEIRTGKEWALSNLLVSKVTGQPHVLVGRGIRGESGALKGVVVTRILPELLDQVLVPGKIGLSSIIILDAAGKAVYAHPKTEWSRDEREWLQAQPFLREAFGGGDVVTDMPGVDGKRRLIAVTPVAGAGWVVGAIRAEDEVLAPIFTHLWSEAGLLCLVAIVSILVSVLMSRNIVSPIKSLREQAQALRRGVPAHPIDIKGPVELQSLANVFNSMNSEIRAREDTLQQARDSLEDRVRERTEKLNETMNALRVEVEERKQAEDGARAAKEVLQSAFDGIREPLMMLEKNMSVRILNESCRRYYGVTDDSEVIGKPCYEGFFGRTAPCEDCIVPSVISAESHTAVERRGFFDPGSIEQVVIYPMQEEANGPSGAIVRISDITEKVKTQKLLLQADRLASLGHLAGGLSHEIRNPLSGISLFLDVLQDESKFNRTSQEISILEEIYSNVRKINGIVKRVLDFAKQSDGTLAPLDVVPLVRDAVRLWQAQMRNGDNRLEVSLADSLPQVLGDAIEIQQVLNNLFQNAFEAIPHGGRIGVSVSSRKSSYGKNRQAVVLEFKDDGPGIPVDIQGSLFNPFFTTKPTGTGLGLSISHQIVTRHGGIISFDSQPGAGTTFRVELPAAAGN